MDCICCGFGAIILLFVLTIGPIKKKTEMSKRGVDTYKQGLHDELKLLSDAIKTTDTALSQSLSTPSTAVDIRSLQEEVLIMEEQMEAKRQEIVAAKSALSNLEQQVVETQEIEQNAPSTPVGVATDSSHLIFIVDTSGSMRDGTGQMNSLVMKQIERTLNAYPTIRGLQIMDSSGNYILPASSKQWLPDTRRNRDKLLSALRNYRTASASNPVPGLVRAFKDYNPKNNPDKNIGIYIFGDEFPHTAAPILSKLNKLNPIDPKTGKRAVVINATGFPFRLPKNPQPSQTGYKFANLMRELTYAHGGAFMVVQSDLIHSLININIGGFRIF